MGLGAVIAIDFKNSYSFFKLYTNSAWTTSAMDSIIHERTAKGLPIAETNGNLTDDNNGERNFQWIS